MGKQYPVYRNNDQSRGILWRIICALDYHHWQNNVRKMLPHKRHNKQNNAKNSKIPKTTPGADCAGEKLVGAETSHSLVNPRTEASPTHKRSLKARVKALVAKMIRKEDDNKRTGLNFPALLQLERTLSVKHLDTSNDSFRKTGKDWRSPIIFFPRKDGATKLQRPAMMMASDWNKFDLYTKESLMDYIEHQRLSQNYSFSGAREISVDQAHATQLIQNASQQQLKEHADVLKLLQINEDLFQEYQQEVDLCKENDFWMPKNSNAKARLTKSGTFPAANLSYLRRKNYKPATLEDKQTETWSSSRGKNLHNETPQRVGSEVFAHMEDQRQKLKLQNNTDKDEVPCDKADRNKLPCSSASLLDQVSNEYLPSMREKQLTRICDTRTVRDDDFKDLNSCNITFGPINNLRSTLRHRRTSSLNDSLHRYARLFDYSFSMTNKLDISKSVRFTNEYDTSSTGNAPISFKRNQSLPHGKSPWPNHDEDSLETLYPYVSSMHSLVCTTATEDNSLSESKPVEQSVGKNSEKCLRLVKNEGNLHSETSVEDVKSNQEEKYLESSTRVIDVCGTTALMNGHCEEIVGPAFEKSSCYKDLQVNSMEIDDDKDTRTSLMDSTLISCLQEDVASPTELSVSEGLEHTCNHSYERESLLTLLNNSDKDSVSMTSTACPENLNNTRKNFKSHMDTKLDKDEESDLSYVRDILTVANFNDKGFHGEWYSSEQPISPLIFDEVEESWWPHESECSQENLILLYHHQLLFDLINESIIQIYETAFTYYPRQLSTSCQVHSLREPSNEEEVLKNLLKYIGFKSELDQPPDDVVERDLSKADGWMNLQTDSECVALELEDLIFDELLEELICT
ncbi:hypothetical protein ACET3Z_005116 [Daucus carota]